MELVPYLFFFGSFVGCTLLSLTECGMVCRRKDVEKTSVVKKAISFQMVKTDSDLLYSVFICPSISCFFFRFLDQSD